MPHETGQSIRIQRSRKKGVCTPEGAVYVGRPTLWGNPFMVARFGHMSAVGLHRKWLTGGGISALRLERMGFHPSEIDTLNRRRADVLTSLHRLAGCNLVCWCPLTSPCHADTLLELAPGYAELERLAA